MTAPPEFPEQTQQRLESYGELELLRHLVQAIREEDFFYVLFWTIKLKEKGLLSALTRPKPETGVSVVVFVATSPYSNFRSLVFEFLLLHLVVSIRAAFRGIDLASWAKNILTSWEATGRLYAKVAAAFAHCSTSEELESVYDLESVKERFPTAPDERFLTGFHPLPPLASALLSKWQTSWPVFDLPTVPSTSAGRYPRRTAPMPLPPPPVISSFAIRFWPIDLGWTEEALERLLPNLPGLQHFETGNEQSRKAVFSTNQEAMDAVAILEGYEFGHFTLHAALSNSPWPNPVSIPRSSLSSTSAPIQAFRSVFPPPAHPKSISLPLVVPVRFSIPNVAHSTLIADVIHLFTHARIPIFDVALGDPAFARLNVYGSVSSEALFEEARRKLENTQALGCYVTLRRCKMNRRVSRSAETWEKRADAVTTSWGPFTTSGRQSVIVAKESNSTSNGPESFLPPKPAFPPFPSVAASAPPLATSSLARRPPPPPPLPVPLPLPPRPLTTEVIDLTADDDEQPFAGAVFARLNPATAPSLSASSSASVGAREATKRKAQGGEEGEEDEAEEGENRSATQKRRKASFAEK